MSRISTNMMLDVIELPHGPHPYPNRDPHNIQQTVARYQKKCLTFRLSKAVTVARYQTKCLTFRRLGLQPGIRSSTQPFVECDCSQVLDKVHSLSQTVTVARYQTVSNISQTDCSQVLNKVPSLSQTVRVARYQTKYLAFRRL